MSPPNKDLVNIETNVMENISVLPKPYQKPYPSIHQVVDGIRSIEWAAAQGLNLSLIHI